MSKDINELLEEWSVHSPGMWENGLLDNKNSRDLIGDWYAVSNDDGIIAYFSNMKDAYRFRIDKINIILNT